MAVYAKEKRRRSKNKNKSIRLFILALIILAIISLLLVNKLLANRGQAIGTMQPVENKQQDSNQEEEPIDFDSIPAKVGEYNVIGKLVIEKIGVDKNILEECTSDSLKLSVTKFYGPGVNEPGNIVICGHNWGGILKRLSELKKGDTFYMINREEKTKVDYVVDDMFTCGPRDLSILDQNNDGRKNVTIYTCTPSGAKRVVCTAHET